jgi:hypothetical protein
MFGGPPIYTPYEMPYTRPVVARPQSVAVAAPISERVNRGPVKLPEPERLGIVLNPPDVQLPEPNELGIKLE